MWISYLNNQYKYGKVKGIFKISVCVRDREKERERWRKRGRQTDRDKGGRVFHVVQTNLESTI